jgi:hypothetical protein
MTLPSATVNACCTAIHGRIVHGGGVSGAFSADGNVTLWPKNPHFILGHRFENTM